MDKSLAAAEKIAAYAADTLCVRLRSVSRAVNALTLCADNGTASYATDATRWLYSPSKIVSDYIGDSDAPSRALLHSLLHCMFLHMFGADVKSERLWNTACDACAALLSEELGFSPGAQTLSAARELSKLASDASAEKIYRALKNSALSETELAYYESVLAVDSHKPWYADRYEKQDDPYSENGETPSIYKRDDDRPSRGEKDSSRSDGDNGSSANDVEQWKRIAEKVKNQAYYELTRRGENAGSFIKSLGAVTLEEESYGDFLRKFAVLRETMLTDDASFDYIFYTYGMELYGNMPLIEPLEYAEKRIIREFVVAIDSSGSIDEGKARRFAEKTLSVLTDGCFGEINVRILQCDSVIQDDVLLKSRSDIEAYFADFKLRGFGGTDFRPVFGYIDALKRDSGGKSVDGLLYFTDGDGIFPEKPPDYPAAFIIDGEKNGVRLPAWAMRCRLGEHELIGGEEYV